MDSPGWRVPWLAALLASLLSRGRSWPGWAHYRPLTAALALLSPQGVVLSGTSRPPGRPQGALESKRLGAPAPPPRQHWVDSLPSFYTASCLL